MITEKEKVIDGLVNNAGVMFAPKSVTEDGIEVHWGVNHLGHFLLTKLLEDSLENGGRVLFMVNLEYRKAYNGVKFEDLNMEKEYDKCYAFYQSQLANVLLTQALASELRPKMITVNCVYPGIVSGTQIKRHMSVDKSFSFGAISRGLLRITERSVKDSVYTPVFLLTDRSVAGITGKMFKDMNEIAYVDRAVDSLAGQKLLAVDEYWTGLKSKEELLALRNKQN